MVMTKIKRAIAVSKFRKVNKHYKAKQTIGERSRIERDGQAAIEVILYRPEKIGNVPAFIQVHGGGWVGMDAVDDDAYCARLSEVLGAFVINLNYKRLYERAFPYQQEEVVDTVKWLIGNAESLGIDRDKIIISGGSAGGHISAGAAIMLAQQNIRIAGQILEVPFLDFAHAVKIDFPQGPKLFEQLFDLFPSQLPLDNPVISPVVASDNTLGKVARASIIVCGKDPLHPHGEYYAERLKTAGNRVELKMYENGYHGFGTDQADEKPEQEKLREDCFWFKVHEAKEMYGEENNDETQN